MKINTIAINAFVAALIYGCHADPATKNTQVPPPAEKFAGISANDFDSVRLQTKLIPSLGISLAFPVNWAFRQFIEQKQAVWTSKESRSDSVKFRANYVLNAAPRQRGMPMKNYGDFIVLNLMDKYKKFKLVNRTNDTLTSTPGITMDYIYFEHGLNLGGTTTLYFLTDNVVVINFVALNEPEGNYVRYRGIYTRTLATVKSLKN